MNRFQPNRKIGVRDWVTMKIIAVYPYAPGSSDEATEQAVRDWFYEQSCDAEAQLKSSFVDLLSDEEASSLPDGLVDDAAGGESGTGNGVQ